MHAIADPGMNVVEQARIDERLGTEARLFGRLEHQVCRGEGGPCLLHLGKQQCGPAQGCGMQVVAARVHHAGIHGAKTLAGRTVLIAGILNDTDIARVAEMIHYLFTVKSHVKPLISE